MHVCTIGKLRDSLLDVQDIKSKLEEEAYGWNSHAKTMNMLQQHRESYKPAKYDYKPTDYLDMRKSGSITMFNNCPYCGNKIDWKAIKSTLKDKS